MTCINGLRTWVRSVTFLVLVCVIICELSGPAVAAVSALRGTDGLVALENGTVRMVVDPGHGGSVVSFVHKPLGKDIIPANRGNDQMGLFLDHYWEDAWPWPGELMPASYEVVETKSAPDETSVRMRYTIKGSFSGKYDARVEGLVFEKTFILRDGVDAVICRVSFTNPTQKSKTAAYWVQNYFHTGGDYGAEKDVFARPGSKGVVRMGRTTNIDFLYDFTRGWTAATDTEKDCGLAFLMDYNYLNSLYNYLNNVTQEWIYDRALIPSGKTWQTEIVLLPFSGIRNITCASRNLLAGLKVDRTGGKTNLTHTLRQGLEDADDVQLSVEVVSGSTGTNVRLPDLKVGSIGHDTKTLTQDVPGNLPDPLIVKVTATGKSAGGAFEETYWDFYTGGYGYGGNVQMDMVTPLYQGKRPEKRQVLLKPDIIRRIPGKPVYYAVGGLFSDVYRIEEAMRLAGQGDVPKEMPTVVQYSLNTYGMGGQVSEFPFDYDVLMRYNAVIAANANIDSLGPSGKEMLYDYLTHGGGLLVLGGRVAFASGGWKGTKLEELLPVELNKDLFDIVKVNNGILRPGVPHSITEGLHLGSKPRVEFVHDVKVKPGAQVLLYAGKKPFLVVWEHNGAKVACILGTPYGVRAPKPGPLFFDWDGWPELMKRVLEWL